MALKRKNDSPDSSSGADTTYPPFAPLLNQTYLRAQAELAHPLPNLTQHQNYEATRNWHGDDPILRAVAIRSLLEGGYINLAPHLAPNDARYTPNRAITMVKGASHTAVFDTEDPQLHPILQRARFQSVDDHTFELLKPVLKLATDRGRRSGRVLHIPKGI